MFPPFFFVFIVVNPVEKESPGSFFFVCGEIHTCFTLKGVILVAEVCAIRLKTRSRPTLRTFTSKTKQACVLRFDPRDGENEVCRKTILNVQFKSNLHVTSTRGRGTRFAARPITGPSSTRFVSTGASNIDGAFAAEPIVRRVVGAATTPFGGYVQYDATDGRPTLMRVSATASHRLWPASNHASPKSCLPLRLACWHREYHQPPS